MRVFVKICGLRTARAVDAALLAGADALGFVFADSPRRVTAEQAERLCADVPPVIIRVAVMQHPTAADWQRVTAGFAPDWLQTDAADYESLTLPESVSPLPVYRDGPVLPDIAAAGDAPILFEASRSGEGIRADWDRAARLAATRPVILAGGLDPDNVGDAIGRVRPWGVDVSSGVESRRGVKDAGRIAAFVAAVRAAEQVYAHG